MKSASKSLIKCKTTVKPIELWNPFIFNPDMLDLEYANLETKSDYYCVLLICIDYRSNIVYISLTTKSNIGEDYIELQRYIGLVTESVINEYTFMCTTSFCNLNYLQMISNTDELNWLLRFEYYFNIASSLKLLLVNKRNNHNTELSCYNNNQRTVICKDGICRAYHVKYGTENTFNCRQTHVAEPEDHYIMTNTIIKPNYKQITIIVTYLCNINFCNSVETFDQIKNLLNITSDASKLSWPTMKTTKFSRETTTQLTRTTNRYFSISTAKEIIPSHTKFASSIIVDTTDANMLSTKSNIMTITDISSNRDNNLKDTSMITNTNLNFPLETSVSTTSIITNNMNRINIRMTFFLLLVLFLSILLDNDDYLQ